MKVVKRSISDVQPVVKIYPSRSDPLDLGWDVSIFLIEYNAVSAVN
jgi:hypothetical protein